MKEGTMEIPSKLSDPSERLVRHSRVKRRARTRRPHREESRSGGQPLVIDKTKEIQMSVYPVYIDYRSVVVTCMDPAHGPVHGPSD